MDPADPPVRVDERVTVEPKGVLVRLGATPLQPCATSRNSA
jgi:hypothetical protein